MFDVNKKLFNKKKKFYLFLDMGSKNIYIRQWLNKLINFLGEDSMKKFLLVTLIGLFTLSLVIGCGQKEEPKTETPATEGMTEEAMPDSTGMAADTMNVDEEQPTEDSGQ